MLTLFFLQDGFFDVSAKFTLRFRMGRARNLEPPAPRRSPAAAPPKQEARRAAPRGTRGGCRSPPRRGSSRADLRPNVRSVPTPHSSLILSATRCAGSRSRSTRDRRTPGPLA
jgi:hypothetical protein